MMENIEFKSRQILTFYSSNRKKWEEFYPSERWVFERIVREKGSLGNVLDVGCACGGLGNALSEKFILNSYTGIDICKDAIEWSQQKPKLSIPATFIRGDIIAIDLSDKYYELVVSLSCADWNLETNKIINACWKKVKPGGYFVISLRLTPEKGINDIKRSYQYINFTGDEKDPEVANYVVFNFRDALSMMGKLTPYPELVGSYGYWGEPSSTAVTPFDRLIFAVFYLKKSIDNSTQIINAEFSLPIDIF